MAPLNAFGSVPAITSRRFLSAQQAAAALRPFYFAVHPDRFARTPEIRTKNEKALQIFNGYLNDLFPINSRPQRPVKVVFSVMKPENGDLMDVAINLSGADAHQIVENALKKLNLPTTDLPKRRSRLSSLYATTTEPTTSEGSVDDLWQRMKANDVKTRKKKATYVSPNELFAQLAKNRDAAFHRSASHSKTKEQLQDDIEFLILKTGIRSVDWSMDWDKSYMRRCLSNVQNMVTHASEDEKRVLLNALKGYPLIFGRGSFVCCDGALQFGADDVPEKWQQVCLEANVRRLEMKNFEQLCARTSELFGGARLFSRPHENLLKAIGELQSIIMKISSKSKGEIMEMQRFARNAVIEITSVYGELALCRDGHVQVPCNVDFAALVEFFKTNAEKAKQMHHLNNQQSMELEQTAKSIRQFLCMKSLTWERNLPTDGVMESMRRLARVDVSVRNLLMGLSLHFSTNPNIFVLNDGRLSVPLDWV